MYIAKTLAGLETVLAEELNQLGATDVKPLKRAVSFEGDKKMLYRANYELRTALRILVPVFSFYANSENGYYKGIRSIDWSKYMNLNDTLAIDAVAFGDVFTHSRFLALLTKDAIVDQFRDNTGRRPDVNTIAPNLRVHVHVQGDLCNILLDSSSDSLHMRNYRRDSVEAPLNEVLAAGMILLTGWDKKKNFIDPMCGSGTLPIEAAMMATNTPPQYRREGFGFFKWPDFDKALWAEVKREAEAKIKPPEGLIIASDIDPRSRNATSLNVMTAEFEKIIRIEKIAFEKQEIPESPGVLMMNPPYDERMKVEEVNVFYKNIGDQFKQRWTGWEAWIISSNREALKNVGLRTSQKITLYNGALECSFQKFELY